MQPTAVLNPLKILPVFVANFFFSLHYAAVLYVNSSFLEQFFSPLEVSFLFVAGAVGNIILFFLIPGLLRGFGNRKVFLSFTILELLAIGMLFAAPSPALVALAFAVYGSVSLLIYYSLDIFLEDASIDARTGEIRGIYLTITSTAIAAAPLLTTLLTEDESLKPIYLASTLLLLPVVVLGALSFKNFEDGKSGETPSRTLPFGGWWAAADVRGATIARFVLEFFYTIMVVFTPIYLNQVVGFDWKEIGIIFAIMLLPFIFLEWPAGEAADRLWGETELMSAGFGIMGIALLALPYLPPTVGAWAAILFLSRIGAAINEVTNEAYFFKHVDKWGTGIISIFRLSRPAAIIAGSLAGAFISSYFSFATLFFIMAAVVFGGMWLSARLRDTL